MYQPSHTSTSKAKRSAVTKLLGWCFMVLGIIGLFLPVLQGLLFLLIGLFILSSHYVWADRILQKLRSRFPTLARRVVEARRKADGWVRRLAGREADSHGAAPSGVCQSALSDPSRITNVASDPAGPRQDVGALRGSRSTLGKSR